MKSLRSLGIVFLLLFSGYTYACDSNKPIKLGALDWESGQFSTALLELILREGYGCQTEIVPGATTALETALTQDDIQIIAEQWVGRSPIIEQAVAEKRVHIIGNTLRGGATQGWYVPTYVKKKHPKLQKVSDLPQFAYLFPDPEHPNKARFLNCPTGWACEIFNTHLLKNTGLSQQFNNVHPGTGAALDAEIAAAYEQKQSILFYYWQPTGLMAKYQFEPIIFPTYQSSCWESLLHQDSITTCISGFPSSRLAMSVSMAFAQQYPTLVALINSIQFEPQILNQAILEMTENKRNGSIQALFFLQQYPELWQQWLSPAAAIKLQQYLQQGDMAHSSVFASWSIADKLNRYLVNTVQDYGSQFRQISQFSLDYLLIPVEKGLQATPAWLMLIIIGYIGWHATRKYWFALLCVTGFYLIGTFGLWLPLMQTLALLIVSALFITLFGIPIGILMASNKKLHQILQPVLDVIQTMPSFVYLIPVLMLFGIGKVPALFATVVYAIAPLIRLTALGIRQVSPQIIEAAQSFGSTRWQLLLWVLLPQAKASIMAGINQAVMMSLGMVVLASMIGAKGLGEHVLQAIQTLNIGQGVEAGTAIVILAIIIDRITQAYGRGQK
ncbi:glycine betaine ABC transporter substrate-binding protein [Pasteurella oralis]|uniref:glycine betaine ABC transporter substrate-binding protein n=1 Tax=Pasteurella oralis TaxID=1071947 RepID=UPI000C7D3736|nr:glycine betaine ABC transporter substrate-binding protein [Pasteurella oralis]